MAAAVDRVLLPVLLAALLVALAALLVEVAQLAGHRAATLLPAVWEGFLQAAVQQLITTQTHITRATKQGARAVLGRVAALRRQSGSTVPEIWRAALAATAL
jgi:hypothetical protein